VGPYSEERQYQRAAAIKRLLDTNPQLDDVTRSMWEGHLRNLSHNEETYNFRVKTIYSKFKHKARGFIDYG
jgi:hypothetical protein